MFYRCLILESDKQSFSPKYPNLSEEEPLKNDF